MRQLGRDAPDRRRTDVGASGNRLGRIPLVEIALGDELENRHAVGAVGQGIPARQRRDDVGTWIDAQVDSNTQIDLENIILSQARLLRNEAKNALVGVPMDLIETHGAVSAEVAKAMAEGGLRNSNADIAVSLTGVAGPGGGTEIKPVGLVHFACAREGRETVVFHEVFPGDRDAVREASVLQALKMLIDAAEKSNPSL